MIGAAAYELSLSYLSDLHEGILDVRSRMESMSGWSPALNSQ